MLKSIIGKNLSIIGQSLHKRAFNSVCSISINIAITEYLIVLYIGMVDCSVKVSDCSIREYSEEILEGLLSELPFSKLGCSNTLACLSTPMCIIAEV